jgi:serine/threonine protein kinase
LGGYLACKQYEREKIDKDGVLYEQIKEEVKALRKIQSENVIKIYGIRKTTSSYYILTQYCNGGNLKEFCKIRNNFTEQEARHLIRQIFNGCKAMADQNILHRDLKLENIMLDIDHPEILKVYFSFEAKDFYKHDVDIIGTVKPYICDFGMSKSFDMINNTSVGTPVYFAPEIWKKEK